MIHANDSVEEVKIEKDSIFISNLYADMSGCIGSNLKEAEPNAERFHRYYAQSNR